MSNPIINGHRFSWASIEVRINGAPVVALRSINYSSDMKPGKVWGSDPFYVGRTPGRAEHFCDFEILRREWDILLETLGPSYGRKSFDIIVQYAEDPRSVNGGIESTEKAQYAQPEYHEQVTTDSVIGCRITRADFQNQDSVDPTTVRVTVDPRDIRHGTNGWSIEEPYPVVDIFETEE